MSYTPAMPSFWKMMRWFYFFRALSRGPGYFVRYEVRRQARRAIYRATRRRSVRPTRYRRR